ncbi:glucose-methanol-choline oxidoreductase [Diaporthe helianthi]|uniref:Glucose-methanol-choline oxidoreductase n=1 Tax=Diaporthe helianthi TaxID=158607 RepID=A0A2P5I7M6_DIAHE|nr:glucose-methanol-choline oxidoreductase [Diaporthe helianthi]
MTSSNIMHTLLWALAAHSAAALPSSSTTRCQDGGGGGGQTRQVDYVVVGGGTAGSVVAEQLSRNPDVLVMLLEAGPDNAGVENIDVPLFAPRLLFTQHAWNYTSQPDPNLNGRTPPLDQGRGFGGGSAINYLGHCRGAASVFNEWADIAGDDGLRWNNLLEHFRAVSHYNQMPDQTFNPPVNHSVYGDGPIELTMRNNDLGIETAAMLAYASTLGLPLVDLSDGTGIGVSPGIVGVRGVNRTRVFAPQAFGWQMATRPNAQQLHHAWVTRVNFEGTRATGVTYVNPDDLSEEITVQAREVILSGGAINTPKVGIGNVFSKKLKTDVRYHQLLMLSGVGPGDHLRSLGVDVVADIPDIGRNLFDHHISFVEYEVVNDVQTLYQYDNNQTIAAQATEDYTQEASLGLMGSPSGVSFAVYRAPDSVFANVNSTFHTDLPADRGHLLLQCATAPLSGNSSGGNVISGFVGLVQPEADGEMHLASSDFRDDPIINSNYWGSDSDKAAMLHGYKRLREVWANPSLNKLLVREVYPGPDVVSDEDLWRAIQNSASTFHHPSLLVGSWRVALFESEDLTASVS